MFGPGLLQDGHGIASGAKCLKVSVNQVNIPILPEILDITHVKWYVFWSIKHDFINLTLSQRELKSTPCSVSFQVTRKRSELGSGSSQSRLGLRKTSRRNQVARVSQAMGFECRQVPVSNVSAGFHWAEHISSDISGSSGWPWLRIALQKCSLKIHSWNNANWKRYWRLKFK